MYKIIKKTFPNLAPILQIIIARMYDIHKFTKHSSSINKDRNKNKLKSFITRQYHGIEKAFSLSETRKGFGLELVDQLCINLNNYIEKYGSDELVKHAVATLNNYKDFHFDFSDKDIHMKNVFTEIERLNQLVEKRNVILSKSMTLKEIEQSTDFNFSHFLRTRKSIRDFDKGDIDTLLIKSCVADAMQTPSACNRQGWRVRLYEGKEKDEILKFQNGNRGFAKSINKVVLITGFSEMYSYTERNGMLVDGSLFAMTLILSLHSKRIGVCPLNTSFTIKQELKLRKAINLNTNEEPIMMLAIGKLKDEFKVANSPRINIDEVLIYG